MKKTKALVTAVVIAVALASSGAVRAASLPKDTLILGDKAYDIGYILKHLVTFNDILNDAVNISDIYYKDYNNTIHSLFNPKSNVDEDKDIFEKNPNITYIDTEGKKISYNSSGKNDVTATLKCNIVNLSGSGNLIMSIAVTDIQSKPSDLKPIYFKITKESDNGTDQNNPHNDPSDQYSDSIKKIYGQDTDSLKNIGDDYVANITVPYNDGITVHILASDKTEIAKGTVVIPHTSAIVSSQDVSVVLTTSNGNEIPQEYNGNTPSNINNNGIVAQQGRWIYYSNLADSGKLYKRNLDGGMDDVKISEDIVKYINIVGDWIYYVNYSDSQKIYKVKTDGTQRRIVCNDQASNMIVSGEYIFYVNHKDVELANIGKLYKVNRDALSADSGQKICDDEAAYINVVGDVIYYTNMSANGVPYSVHVDGTYRSKLSNEYAKYLTVVSNTDSTIKNIYYITSSGELHRIQSTDGNLTNPFKIPIKITDGTNNPKNGLIDKLIGMNIINDKLYYWSYIDGKKMYTADSLSSATAIPLELKTSYNELPSMKIENATADSMNTYMDGSNSKVFYTYGTKLSMVNDPVLISGTNGSASTYKYSSTAITAPKLPLKITSYTKAVFPINDLPAGIADKDIVEYLPDKTTAVMSDGSVQEVLINWDLKSGTASTSGISAYKGVIVGYGGSVSISISNRSATISPSDVKVTNNGGTLTDNISNIDDTSSIKDLYNGDVISVYRSKQDAYGNDIINKDKLIGTAIVSNNKFSIDLKGTNILSESGENIWITRTSVGKLESDPVEISVPEATKRATKFEDGQVILINYGDAASGSGISQAQDFVIVKNTANLRSDDNVEIAYNSNGVTQYISASLNKKQLGAYDPKNAGSYYKYAQYKFNQQITNNLNNAEGPAGNIVTDSISVLRLDKNGSLSDPFKINVDEGLALPMESLNVASDGKQNTVYVPSVDGGVEGNGADKSGYMYYYYVRQLNDPNSVPPLSGDSAKYLADFSGSNWTAVNSKTRINFGLNEKLYLAEVSYDAEYKTYTLIRYNGNNQDELINNELGISPSLVVTTDITTPVKLTNGSDSVSSIASTLKVTASGVPSDNTILNVGNKKIGFKAGGGTVTGADAVIDTTINSSSALIADAVEAYLNHNVVTKINAGTGDVNVELQAVTAGTSGNVIPITTTSSLIDVGTGSLNGGVDATTTSAAKVATGAVTITGIPVDGDILTVGNTIITFQAGGTGSNVIDTDGKSKDQIADAIEALLNCSVVTSSTAVAGNSSIDLQAAVAGASGTSLSVSETVPTGKKAVFMNTGSLTGGKDFVSATKAGITIAINGVPVDKTIINIGNKKIGFKAGGGAVAGADFIIDTTIYNTATKIAGAIEELATDQLKAVDPTVEPNVIPKSGAEPSDALVELEAAEAGTAGNTLTVTVTTP